MYDTDREMLRQHEIAKVNRAAERIMDLGYVSTQQLQAIFREFGVASCYFNQMYELEWCYVWEKEKSLEWEVFIREFIWRIHYEERIGDDVLAYEKLALRYRLNEKTGMVDEYHQQYRYKVAFKKRNTLNLSDR